jgi:CheY-like chemotaxis protein/HPt (histidine-containing phosphotransfer) domain-containing protein
MIDQERLAAIARGSDADQAHILAEFRRVNLQDTLLLRDAVRENDFEEVTTLAHRMKGASMMLGATDFSEACSLVTMAGRAADRKTMAYASEVLDREMTRLDAYLVTLHQDPTPAPAPLSAVAPASAGEGALLCSNLSFLVVEDHAFQRNLIMRFLARLGALEVRGFEDGGGALDALRARPVDIMVLDLSMPGIDGMDLMRTLSGIRHPISVILNSALSPSLMASLIQMAKSYRVNLLGAVTKPLNEGNLAPLIAKFRAGRPDAAAPLTAKPSH